MGSALGRSQGLCPSPCPCTHMTIDYSFPMWLSRHRPVREAFKLFPRIFRGQRSYDVLTQAFGASPTNKDIPPSPQVQLAGENVAIDCFQIVNELHALSSSRDTRSFLTLCGVLDAILSNPQRYTKFMMPWQHLQHAHVMNHILVFHIPPEIPHLIVVLYFGPHTALTSLDPCTLR
eukprot:NODE_9245_length_609_cov_25.913580_g8613_i0.p1 GENE.NODE_9245_length_609_cov_25.913580_g8613_i0~~NODE_9245_length_609_cov_25.913580_g8613_i0.p1  ORF type:complete len:176 (+),score=16.77 NODE_9245_length_609_cov_25.913580_g8613_i0:80-607(+)